MSFIFRIVFGLTVYSFVATQTLPAASPVVHFDATYTVACNDVTSEIFAQTNPNERMIEARFQVSSLIELGDEDDLIQYFYRIEYHGGSASVVDYFPKTTLSTQLAGNIGVEKKDETDLSLGATVTTPFKETPKITGSAGASKKKSMALRYDLLPPMELVASSGTIGRGRGVYFKLKPSNQTTLEGGKEFVVVFRVPCCWRTGLVHVKCRTLGVDRGVVRSLDEKKPSGMENFIVAIYLNGDEEAKLIAENYVRAELQLRRVVARSREEINKRSFPSFSDKFGSFFSAVEPKIPPDWFARLMYSRPENALGEYSAHLPDAVLAAADSYVDAKRSLLQFNRMTSNPPQHP